VRRGHWHGDVAIKILDMGNEPDNQLVAFRQEVSTFFLCLNFLTLSLVCDDSYSVALVLRPSVSTVLNKWIHCLRYEKSPPIRTVQSQPTINSVLYSNTSADEGQKKKTRGKLCCASTHVVA
jgi:hypothetical protein